MRWREAIAYGWLAALVVVVVGVAWLTRHPESMILVRAEDWPVIGAAVETFRRAYLPDPGSGSAAAPQSPPGPSTVPRQTEAPEVDELYGARPQVWAQPGARLYARPDLSSATVGTIESIRNLRVVSRDGDWYQVQLPRPGIGTRLPWLHLPDYEAPSLEELSQAEPVLPLAAVEISEETLSAARALMAVEGRRRQCGEYDLVSDVDRHRLLELCPLLSKQVDQLFRSRYGLEPVGPPGETVLLFARRSDYEAFRDSEPVAVESNVAHALPSRGYLATWVGDRTLADLTGSLIHEMVHLVGRRALGPALPPWLGEGLADDLAQSHVAVDGTLTPGRLGGELRAQGERASRTGGFAAAIQLQKALDQGRLPTLPDLVAMDAEEFRRRDRVQLHYAASSAWVRYLLSDFDAGLRPRFQQFLQQVAAGQPLTEELLWQTFDRDPDSLERSFRAWLRLQYLTPVDEVWN